MDIHKFNKNKLLFKNSLLRLEMFYKKKNRKYIIYMTSQNGIYQLNKLNKCLNKLFMIKHKLIG